MTTRPSPRSSWPSGAGRVPPFSFQALLRAEARTQEVAQGFLEAASAAATHQLAHLPGFAGHAVPGRADGHAAGRQCGARADAGGEPLAPALQTFLRHWHGVLHATRQTPAGKGLLRWAVDVDPLAI
jgi:primosomal protein N' (replication factor Y)